MEPLRLRLECRVRPSYRASRRLLRRATQERDRRLKSRVARRHSILRCISICSRQAKKRNTKARDGIFLECLWRFLSPRPRCTPIPSKRRIKVLRRLHPRLRAISGFMDLQPAGRMERKEFFSSRMKMFLLRQRATSWIGGIKWSGFPPMGWRSSTF